MTQSSTKTMFFIFIQFHDKYETATTMYITALNIYTKELRITL